MLISISIICVCPGTNLFSTVPFHLNLLREAYDTLFPTLFSTHPSLFPQDLYTFENFLWAHSTIASRAFPAWMGRRVTSDVKGPAPLMNAASVNAGTIAAQKAQNDNNLSVGSSHHSSSGEDSDPTPTNMLDTISCLIPFLDLMNHHSDSSVTWLTSADISHPQNSDPSSAPSPFSLSDPNRGKWDGKISEISQIVDENKNGGKNNITINLTELDGYDEEVAGTLMFQSDHFISGGKEVFNNYGPKSNERYLIGYGFVLPDNPYDSFAVSISGMGVHPRSLKTHQTIA